MHITVTASNGKSANEVRNANRMSNVFLGQWKQLHLLKAWTFVANASAEFWSNVWKMFLTARPWAELRSCSSRSLFVFWFCFCSCFFLIYLFVYLFIYLFIYLLFIYLFIYRSPDANLRSVKLFSGLWITQSVVLILQKPFRENVNENWFF